MTELEELEIAKVTRQILNKTKLLGRLAKRNCIDNEALSTDMEAIEMLCKGVLRLVSNSTREEPKRTIRRVEDIDTTKKGEIPVITIHLK